MRLMLDRYLVPMPARLPDNTSRPGICFMYLPGAGTCMPPSHAGYPPARPARCDPASNAEAEASVFQCRRLSPTCTALACRQLSTTIHTHGLCAGHKA